MSGPRARSRRDRVAGDVVFERGRDDDGYRIFTVDDERALHDSFARYGRERFWDL